MDSPAVSHVLVRCIGFAAEFLCDLEHHPAFPEVLKQLARIDGPIFRGDIEHAVPDVLKLIS